MSTSLMLAKGQDGGIIQTELVMSCNLAIPVTPKQYLGIVH